LKNLFFDTFSILTLSMFISTKPRQDLGSDFKPSLLSELVETAFQHSVKLTEFLSFTYVVKQALDIDMPGSQRLNHL